MRKMQPSRKEIEVKLAFESGRVAREKLLAAGATVEQERTFEDNVVYDTPDLALKRADRILRLRRFGDACTLTFKAPVAGETRHKVRHEYESRIDDFDALGEIFVHLGFDPVYRYQKYRTRLSLGELEAVIDETPIGCFVELEGRPEAIDAVAASLGFSPDRYILATYRELQERHAEERGQPAGDMLLTDPPE